MDCDGKELGAESLASTLDHSGGSCDSPPPAVTARVALLTTRYEYSVVLLIVVVQ